MLIWYANNEYYIFLECEVYLFVSRECNKKDIQKKNAVVSRVCEWGDVFYDSRSPTELRTHSAVSMAKSIRIRLKLSVNFIIGMRKKILLKNLRLDIMFSVLGHWSNIFL